MLRFTLRSIVVALFAFVIAAFVADSTWGQLRRRPLLPRRQPRAEVLADALIGSPYGVGFATFDLPGGANPGLIQDGAFSLTEKNGRVFYAAFDQQPVRAAIRELLGINQPILAQQQKVRIHFLFVGNQPLELTLNAGVPLRQVVQPRDNAQDYDAVLADWWDEYTKPSRAVLKNDEYPQVVDQYLQLMLARRLGLEEPKERILTQVLKGDGGGIGASMGVLLGSESLRNEMQKARWTTGVQAPEIADRPLPSPLRTPAIVLPQVPADVGIEPIALRVPQECFYVRYGTFSNFLWFQDTMDEWGGDLRNLISFRGVDYGINAKTQTQLAVKQGPLAKLLGPAVIADVAMIGTDTFMREGAAFGILFQARNNFALGNDLRGHRADALKANPDAKDETIEIEGRKVAFLHTPDNRIRSFYVVDGDYHLVTTSRRIVERFLETGAKKDSLGASEEFRYARLRMPLSRGDTVFAYLGDAFFRNLSSPAYRIEMGRRMRSLIDADELRLAKMVAAREGLTDLTDQNLVKLGYLPPGFGRPVDGSNIVAGVDGNELDSIRGARGSFIPIPDLPIEKVTATEAAAYETFARELQAKWTRVDPVMAGINRYTLPKPTPETENRERVVIDLLMAPVAKRSLNGFEKYLGSPTKLAAQPLPEDAVLLQFNARGGGLLGTGADPETMYAIGMRDSVIPWRLQPGIDVPLPQNRADAKLYAAAWPQPGLLKFLGAIETPLNPGAATPIPGGGLAGQDLWQTSRGSLSIICGDQATLADVAARFPLGEAERPAQIRLHIADVQAGQMKDFMNAIGFFRARQVSAGNLRFLSLLVDQLGVKTEDARTLAENLIQGKLVDPLGGDYELAEVDGSKRWRGTAGTLTTGGAINRIPDGFLTPTMKWFRGLDADVAFFPDEYSAHIEVEMRRQPRAEVAPAPALPAIALPKFFQKDPPVKDQPAATDGLPPRPMPPTTAERGVRTVPPPPVADPPPAPGIAPTEEELPRPSKRVPPPLPRPE